MLSIRTPVSPQLPRTSNRCVVVSAKLNPTIYRRETRKLFKMLITRQAVKTALHFLSETNGEMHLYLHNHLVQNPISTDTDGDEWLTQLAMMPPTVVKNPARSSIPSAHALEAATAGEREVSPRELVNRIMTLREYLASEAIEDLSDMKGQNEKVMREIILKTSGGSL